jgi:hypothetical protein
MSPVVVAAVRATEPIPSVSGRTVGVPFDAMRAVLSVPLLSLALAGCDRVLGIDELPYGTEIDGAVKTACEKCEAASCSAERAACTGECAALIECERRCALGDARCRYNCEQQKEPAWRTNEAYLALDACLRRGCVDGCYGTGTELVAIDGQCGCAEAGCASKEIACIQSDLVAATPDAGAAATGLLPGNCERRIACLAGDVTPDRYVECATLFPTSAKAFSDVLDCGRLAADCSKVAACQLPTNELACLGAYTFGSTQDASKRVSIFVGDGGDSPIRPVAGVRVTACKPGPCAKCQPISDAASTGLTGADGKVTITVPTPGGLTPGGGIYTGCLKAELDGSDYVTTYVDTGRVIHLDEDVLVTLLFKVPYAIVADPTGNPDFTTHGHVIGTAYDCLWGGMTGATIETDAPGARVYYVADSVMPAWTKTGPKGAFAVFDVPVGNWNLTVKRGDTVVATHPISMAAGIILDANVFPQVNQ